MGVTQGPWRGVVRAVDQALVEALAAPTRPPSPAVLTAESIRRMVARARRAQNLVPDPGILILAHEADVGRIRLAVAVATDHGEELRPVEVRASPLVMTRDEAYVVDLAELEDATSRPVLAGGFSEWLPPESDWSPRPALRAVDVIDV